MGEASIVRYPLFIDLHDHFREPSTNHSETIASGTEAALYGGYILVNDMSNNPGHPTWTRDRVDEKLGIAKQSSRVMFGAWAGWQPYEGYEPIVLRDMASQVVGLKNYATKTTGNDKELEFRDFKPGILIFDEYAHQKPIALHPANIDQVEQYMVDVAGTLKHHVHICHVNDPAVADLVARYRKNEFPVSSAVTAHHLTKTAHDRLTHGKFAEMMPELAHEVDVEKLMWQLSKGIIDAVETDHAPHSKESKMKAEHEGGDCFGVPGVDVTFQILNYQVRQNRISRNRLVDAMHTRPAEIIGYNYPKNSYAEWDESDEATFRIEDESKEVHSGAGWTPFLGQMASGRLVSVVIKGKTVYHRDNPDIQPLSHHKIDPIFTGKAA